MILNVEVLLLLSLLQRASANWTTTIISTLVVPNDRTPSVDFTTKAPQNGLSSSGKPVVTGVPTAFDHTLSHIEQFTTVVTVPAGKVPTIHFSPIVDVQTPDPSSDPKNTGAGTGSAASAGFTAASVSSRSPDDTPASDVSPLSPGPTGADPQITTTSKDQNEPDTTSTPPSATESSQPEPASSNANPSPGDPNTSTAPAAGTTGTPPSTSSNSPPDGPNSSGILSSGTTGQSSATSSNPPPNESTGSTGPPVGSTNAAPSIASNSQNEQPTCGPNDSLSERRDNDV